MVQANPVDAAGRLHQEVLRALDLGMLARWDRADAVPDGNFEGAGEPSRMAVWRSVVPDPSHLLRLAPDAFSPSATRT